MDYVERRIGKYLTNPQRYKAANARHQKKRNARMKDALDETLILSDK